MFLTCGGYTLENANLKTVNTTRLLQRVPHVLEDALNGAPTGVIGGSTNVCIMNKKIS